MRVGTLDHVRDAVRELSARAPDGWARLAGVVMRCGRHGLRPVEVIRAVRDMAECAELERNASGDARLAEVRRMARRATGPYRRLSDRGC